jgi:hypothetical protein
MKLVFKKHCFFVTIMILTILTHGQNYFGDTSLIHLKILDSVLTLKENEDIVDLHIEVDFDPVFDSFFCDLFIYNFYNEIKCARLDKNSLQVYKQVPFGLGFIIENMKNDDLEPYDPPSINFVNLEDIGSDLKDHWPSIDMSTRKLVYGAISRNQIDKKPYEKIVLKSSESKVNRTIYPMIRHNYKDLEKGEYKIYLLYSLYWQDRSIKDLNDFLKQDKNFKINEDYLFSGCLISNEVKLIVESGTPKGKHK